MLGYINLFLLFALGIHSASSQAIRLLLAYDSENQAAQYAFQAVQSYVTKTKPNGIELGEVTTITVNPNQRPLSVEDVCAPYGRTVTAGTPPHLVLDLTKAGYASEIIKAITLALGLPTISGSYGLDSNNQWENLNSMQHKYLIRVMPPGAIIPQVIADIARVQNMTNAAILYDDTFEMESQYKNLLQNKPVRHMIVKVGSSGDEIEKQLMTLEDLDLVNFFVLGRVTTINQVLTRAAQMNFFVKKFAWYGVTKEEGDLYIRAENATILFSYPKMNADIAASTYVKTLNLNFSMPADAAFYYDLILRSLTAVKNMIDAKEWPTDLQYFQCDEERNQPVNRSEINLRKYFNAANVTPSYAPFMLSTNQKSFPQLELRIDRNDFSKNRLTLKTNIGTWKSGLPGSIEYAKGQSLAPFAATTIYRVVTVIQAPFVMKRKEPNGTTTFYGYCIDLLHDIQDILDFEYELYEAPDGLYGNMDENMTWNGMIRELIDRRADIGLGALSVMAERENVIDFTVPYYDLVGISILMSKPTVSTSLFKFLTVLENDVWGCILAAYFFTSILLWIFDRWSPYSYQNNKEKYEDDPEEEKREFTLKESLWFCMTSLTPQGGGEAPKHLSGRLIAATWWLFGFIIIASYTANLAAFLTVSRLDSPVNSLDDLANQYKIQYAPLNGSATMTYFERMAYIERKFYEIWKDMSLNDSMSEVDRAKLAVWDYPVSDKYTKIWQAMQDAGLPQTFEDALARVRTSTSDTEGFAYIGDATDVRYQVLTNCDFQMIGEEFSRKPYALAVQEGSPLRDLLNDAILRLLNQRRLETLKERWWTANPERKDCGDSNSQSDGISIENIGGVFIVIFVGIALACITLAFEYCYYKWYKGGVPDPDSTESSATVRTSNYSEDVLKGGKKPPYILDSTGKDGKFATDYNGFYRSKEDPVFGGDGPRPRKAW